MEGTVDRETAEKEINSWLDSKRVSEKKKEAYKDHVESLVDAVMTGNLLLKEDKTLVHKLKFEVEGEMGFKQLEYKPRLKISTIQSHLQGVKASDSDGRIVAYVAALTTKPKAMIGMLDSEDYAISSSIAVFFV